MADDSSIDNVSVYSEHFPPDKRFSRFWTIVYKMQFFLLSYGLALYLLVTLSAILVNYVQEPASVFLLLINFNMILAILGLAIWRLGERIKEALNNAWNRSTPPFNFDQSVGLTSEKNPYRRLYLRTKISAIQEPEADLQNTVAAATRHFLIGILLMVVGALVGGVLTESNVLSQIDPVSIGSLEDEIPLIGAAISILLGRVVGLILLSILYSSNSIETFVLVAFLIVVPMYSFIPAAENIIRFVNVKHYNQIIPEPGEELAKKDIIVDFSLILILVFAIAYLSHTLLS